MTTQADIEDEELHPLDNLDWKDPANRAAREVIRELKSRGGFDGWWDCIDDDTQFETVVGIADGIRFGYSGKRTSAEIYTALDLRPLSVEEMQEMADNAIKEIMGKALHGDPQQPNHPVKDYCAEQVYVVTPQKSVVHNQPQGNRAMSDIKKSVLDLAAAIEAEMKIGEAGIVEVSSDLYTKLLPEALTPEIVKVYQDHTSDLVAGTAEALANIAIPAFKADANLEQLSVEFGCGSDSLAGTIQRSKEYPAGGIPKEGEVRDPNATVTKFGIVSMKYGVNAHANKGSLKKVRDGINKRAAEALAKA